MSTAIGTGARVKDSERLESLEILAPFMPRSVVNELCSGRVFEEYRRRRLAMFRAATLRAIWEQKQMAQEMAGRETRFVDGLGQHKMIVHPLLQAIAEKKWGKGCWQDKGFQNHTLKHSPELRVPKPAPRSILVNGFRDEETTS